MLVGIDKMRSLRNLFGNIFGGPRGSRDDDSENFARTSHPDLLATNIDADIPLSDPRHDALGRSDFAKSLARVISRYESTDGFVVALCGTWGSGKSSLLRFVEHYLKDDQETPKLRQPIVIRFNPWWFSGPENVINQFLNAFRAGLHV